MTDDKRKRGRPAVADPRRASITAWFTSKEYRAILADAQRREVPLSSALRDRALARLNKPTD
jgi:hypothetical protein